MIAYSQKVEDMACVAQEVHHGAAPIPEEGKWVKSKNVQDIIKKTIDEMQSGHVVKTIKYKSWAFRIYLTMEV